MRYSILSLLVIGSLTTAAHAQSATCANANDATNSVASGITGFRLTGPNQWAFRYVPTTAVVARAMRIFTGNPRAGFMSIEIWDEDAVTKLPLTRIVGGTWQTPNPSPNAWRGANFDSPLVLKTNTPYWIVWVEPGFSQLAWESGGRTMLQHATWDGSAWKAAPARALKFRMYCKLLDDKGVVPFGPECADAFGIRGTAFTNEAATFGNANYRIEGSGFPSAAPALLFLGASPGWRSVSLGSLAPGCSLNTDVALVLTGQTGSGDVRASTASGHVVFPIPLSSVLRGTFFATQLAVVDAASKNPLKLVFSNALRTTVQ